MYVPERIPLRSLLGEAAGFILFEAGVQKELGKKVGISYEKFKHLSAFWLNNAGVEQGNQRYRLNSSMLIPTPSTTVASVLGWMIRFG